MLGSCIPLDNLLLGSEPRVDTPRSIHQIGLVRWVRSRPNLPLLHTAVWAHEVFRHEGANWMFSVLGPFYGTSFNHY